MSADPPAPEPEQSVTVRVDVRGLDRFRLLRWELEELASDMRVGMDRFAGRLAAILERYGAAEEDDRGT